MDPTLALILKDIYSSTVLKRRLRILKDFLLMVFFGKEEQKGKGTAEEDHTGLLNSSPADQAWLNSLPKDFIGQFNKDNVYQIFTDLEKKAQSLPVLTLYLPIEVSATGLAQIGTRVRSLFGPDILIENKVDINLIAGCALGWKGVLKDYSLKTKIETKKGEILESFKRFLRTGADEKARTKIMS